MSVSWAPDPIPAGLREPLMRLLESFQEPRLHFGRRRQPFTACSGRCVVQADYIDRRRVPELVGKIEEVTQHGR